MAGGPEDEAGHGGGAAAGEVEGFVQRAASGTAGTVMILAAGRGDLSEEGLHADGAVAVPGFAGTGGVVVREEGGVLIELLHHGLPIAKQGGPQSLFDPRGAQAGDLFRGHAPADIASAFPELVPIEGAEPDRISSGGASPGAVFLAERAALHTGEGGHFSEDGLNLRRGE